MKILPEGHCLFFLVVLCITDSTYTLSQIFNMPPQIQLRIMEWDFLFGQIISIKDIARTLSVPDNNGVLSPPSVLCPDLSDTVDIPVPCFSSCLNLFLNSHLFLFFGEHI